MGHYIVLCMSGVTDFYKHTRQELSLDLMFMGAARHGQGGHLPPGNVQMGICYGTVLLSRLCMH